MELGVSLAHELVHCAQIIRGAIKIGKSGSVIWAGKKRLPNRKLFFVVLLKEFDIMLKLLTILLAQEKCVV